MAKNYLNVRWRIIAGILSLLVTLMCAGMSAMAAGSLTLEQARIYMPEIDVFLYADGMSPALEDISVSLGNEKLAVDELISVNDEGVCSDFYVLVDISKSLAQSYYASIRQAVLSFQKGMNRDDTLTLITFGDNVNVLAERVTYRDNIQNVVEQIAATDDNTHLFEAFGVVEKMADQEEYALHRSVAVIMTDGEDFSENTNTRNQALEQLNKIGMPVYAMAVKQTAWGNENTFVESFSDFASETGGQLFLFGEGEAEQVLMELQAWIQSAQLLKLHASSNRVFPSAQPLSVKLPGVGSEALEVRARYGHEDKDAPTAAAELLDLKKVVVTFNEPVLKADISQNYRVTLDGENVPVNTVTYDEGEKYQATLVFSDALKAGEYTLTFRNIIDTSMEENSLADELSWSIEPETETEKETEKVTEIVTERITEMIIEPEPEPVEEPPFWKKNLVAIIAISAVLLLLIILLAVRASKKNKTAVIAESTLDNNTLTFEIRDDTGTKTKRVNIDQVITIGRNSADSDVSFPEDGQLSRKHFSIEKDNGTFYVRDLNSTNGTIVNGVRIEGRCRLKNGDVIQAGSLYITVSW